MNLNREALQQLIKLQAQDKVIDALQTAIEKVPVDIAAVKKELEAEKAKMTEAKTKLTKLQLAKKDKELEMSQKEEAIRKHGNELNSVKSNDAYKALLSEIEKAKAAVSDLETAILQIMEDLDQAAKEEKAEQAKVKEVEAKAQTEIKSLEEHQAKLTAEAAQEKSKREALTGGIPADVMKLYDHLRKRNKGVALAVVQGTICGACKITILPQSLIELTKGSKVISCESCQRILYNAETPAEHQPA